MWYLLAVGVAACSGGPERVGYHSGSRLRARVLDVGDARSFVGFHDRTLNIDCSFRLATDGVVRCLPDVPLERAYGDPACSTVVGQPQGAACSTSTPTYAATSVGTFAQSSCNPGTPTDTYYAIGAPVSSTVYLPPNCTPLAFDHVFAVTPVAPSTFVGGSELLEPHGALGSRVVVGDDGSRLTVGAYDVAQGRACAPTDLHDGGAKRCLPLNVAKLREHFADAQCTQPVAELVNGCGAPDLIVADEDFCALHTMFAVASTVALSIVYVQGPAGCIQSQVPGGDFYVPGQELASDAFPALVDVAVGSGPVRVGAFGDVSGATLDFGTGSLVLAGSQRSCSPARDGKKILRCIDDAAATVIYNTRFSDAACTQPVAEPSLPCATTTPAPYLVEWGGADCPYPGIAQLFAAGATVGIFTPTGNGCVQQAGDPGYEVGRVLGVESLPVVHALVE